MNGNARTANDPQPPRRSGLRFAWFGGVSSRQLASAPSEWTFYDNLGLVVLLIACASGFAACLAASYVLAVPPIHVWWVGAAWTLTMACGIERLVLQLSSKNVRWLVAGLVPRILLSLLVAIGMEPLILAINNGEISGYLRERTTEQTRAERIAATNHYLPRIERDDKEITRIRAHKGYLTARVEHFRFLASCETSTPSCSITHQPTCGSYCAHDRREAGRLQSQLAAVQPEDHLQIMRLQQDITNQQEARKQDEKRKQKAVAESEGLSTRLEALSAVEKKHGVVGFEVWFFRALFITVDLLPLTARVLRMLCLEWSPYEAACKAARHQDVVAAQEEDAAANVRETEIEERRNADTDVARARIRADRDRRIAAVYDVDGSPAVEPDDRRTADIAPPIDAWDLRTFVQSMTAHETRPVSVPPALRRGGLVGLSLALTVAVVMRGLSSAVGDFSGMWLVWTCLSFMAALTVYTRGYRRGPAWALKGIFATLITGLLLPIVMLGANL
jgi:Domain of unknown function (DUF4407)